MSATAVPVEVEMRVGAAFWVNRTSWPDLRAACLAAEDAGWESLWIDDHLLVDEGDSRDGRFAGPATLAALAVLTHRMRLGLLGASNTFRNPGSHGRDRRHARPPFERTRGGWPGRWLVRAGA